MHSGDFFFTIYPELIPIFYILAGNYLNLAFWCHIYQYDALLFNKRPSASPGRHRPADETGHTGLGTTECHLTDVFRRRWLAFSSSLTDLGLRTEILSKVTGTDRH